MTRSVFEDRQNDSYPYQFEGELALDSILGGVPSDPKVAEGWLRTKIKDTDQRIQEMVAETMTERGVTAEEAITIINEMKNLNGFKRGLAEDGEHTGQLYVEGRQLKAAIKEAVSVAVGADKIKQTGWGQTRKYLTNFVPEHIFVLEKKLWLYTVDKETGETSPVLKPTDVYQQFVHTHRGSSIQYQEFVVDCRLSFTVVADWDFSDKEWSLIWTTGEKNGLGASRSQGHGTYAVTKWNPLKKK